MPAIYGHCMAFNVSKAHRVQWCTVCRAAAQRGSVRERRDGDVDDENTLVGDAALRRHGGGLHLEPHGARSVQAPQGEDDPPARLVPDAEHSARGLTLRLLLQHGEGRALLQDSRLGEGRQPDHIVIGRDAGGQREQLVLQQQRGSSRCTVTEAGPVAGPGREGERVTVRFFNPRRELYCSR